MSDEATKDTLGSTLRKARESRGLSLDQVSSATKIHVKIIQDLEMDRYDELPAEPFTRGFIYNYARFLSLSTPKIFADYKDFLEEKWKRGHSRSRGVSGYAFERPEGEQSRRMLWAIMVGMFILGVLVIVVFKPTLKHKKHGHIDQLRAAATPTPTPTATATAILAAVPSVHTSVIITSSLPLALQTPAVMVSTLTSPSVLPSISAVASPLASLPSVAAIPTVTASIVIAPISVPTPIAPLPTPTPTLLVVTPVPSNRADQLQNGSDYEPSTVKHKFIFKALADVTVQYRCDDKNLMRFTLRKDRILVLRGKESIRLQVSNPRSIAVSLGTKGYIPLAEARSTFTYSNTATFIQPLSLKDKMAEKWDGAIVLGETPDPAPEAEEEAVAPVELPPDAPLSPTL